MPRAAHNAAARADYMKSSVDKGKPRGTSQESETMNADNTQKLLHHQILMFLNRHISLVDAVESLVASWLSNHLPATIWHAYQVMLAISPTKSLKHAIAFYVSLH